MPTIESNPPGFVTNIQNTAAETGAVRLSATPAPSSASDLGGLGKSSGARADSAAALAQGNVPEPLANAQPPRRVDACALAMLAILLANEARDAAGKAAEAEGKIASSTSREAADKILQAAVTGAILGGVMAVVQGGAAIVSTVGGLCGVAKAGMGGKAVGKVVDEGIELVDRGSNAVAQAGGAAANVGNAVNQVAGRVSFAAAALPELGKAVMMWSTLLSSVKEGTTGGLQADAKRLEAESQDASGAAQGDAKAQQAQEDAIRTFMSVINDIMKAEAERANIAARA